MDYGSTMVLPGAKFNARSSVQAILQEKCTAIYGTPTMYVDLLEELRLQRTRLPPVEVAVVGGSPCSAQLMLDIHQQLGVKHVRSGYGMTELASSSFVSDRGDPVEAALDSVGKIIDHCEAKVVDQNGRTVPFGTPGELWFRGFGTMLGFWGDEAKTKEVLGRDGWLKTGDQFILKKNGYGKIVGRIKDIIIRGGDNVYPKEVEDVLDTHPGILESYCIGVPDERLGERVCAFVRVEDTAEGRKLDLDAIKMFCQSRIANFKIPEFLRKVEQFPTTSGKVKKNELLEMFDKQIAENKEVQN